MSSERATRESFLELDVAADAQWQMHLGERFALEGVLRNLRPRLAIEVGRAEGGSLRRIAAHSDFVHSFDLVPPSDDLEASVKNAEFHTGDSTVQLPDTLRQLGDEGKNVDFALVDGDHSSEGVRRDAEALLAADCCRDTVILFHDAANDEVRAGLEMVDFAAHPKVALVMLDFVPGFLVEKGPYSMQIWNGLGAVVLGEKREPGPPITEPWRFDASAVARLARDAMRSPAPEPAPVAEIAAPEGARRSSVRLNLLSGLAGAAAAAVIGAGLRRRR